MDVDQRLSGRERQLLEILYALEEATAQEVWQQMEDPPGLSAVRKWLFLMEGKGLLRHRKAGRQFYYAPVIPRENALKHAFGRLTDVFFKGSKAHAVTAFLKDSENDLTEDDVNRIQALINERKAGGRDPS